MESLKFSNNGWIVHLPNPEADPDYYTRGAHGIDSAEFGNRRPVLADPRTRHVYVGAPGWYHFDTGLHHGDINEWDYDRGYFDGGPQWGNGNLKWYGPAPEAHTEIAEALQGTGFEIPNANDAANAQEDHFADEDWEDEEPWEEVPHLSG